MITRDIYTPVTDGWSSLDCVMQESTEKIDFLKYMTKQAFPEEEDYFLKQMGKELHCSQGFAMRNGTWKFRNNIWMFFQG